MYQRFFTKYIALLMIATGLWLVILSISGANSGKALLAAEKSDHTCRYVGTECENTGDQRCDAYFDSHDLGGFGSVGQGACTGTGCFYCDGSGVISSYVCLYLEGSTCTYNGEKSCGFAATVFVAEECTYYGEELPLPGAPPGTTYWEESCSCDDAMETTGLPDDPNLQICIGRKYGDCGS